MKVLTVGDAVVVIPMGGTNWETLAGESIEGRAIVTELDESVIGDQIRAAVKDNKVNAREMELSLVKDVKWFTKPLLDIKVGAAIGLKETSRGHLLDIPEDAKPNRAEGIAKGDRIAIGPEISPQYLMNAHGTVLSVNGAKVRIELDEDDHGRIVRRSGKQWDRTMKFPKTSVEKVSA